MSHREPQESDRERLEKALQASNERFSTLVQLSFDVYWETDAEHRFTRQDFAPTLLNAPAPGSEIGKTRWEVPYLEPDEEAWRRHRATLAAHLPFRDFELARPTADRGTRHVSVSGFPIFDEDGRFLGYRGVGRDITQRKRAEAQHRAHLWFLQSMDRISRAMQGTDHFQEMVNNVLGEVLDIFQCERAVLSVFGTRSGTAWYKRLAIKLRAGHDHRDSTGIEYVADEDANAMRMEVRAAARPVAFVLGSVPPHIARVHAHFRTQSVLSISIEAKQERREYDHFYYLEYRSMLLCTRLDRGRDAAVRGDRAPAWRCIDQALHAGGSAAARCVPVRGTTPQPHGELGVGPGSQRLRTLVQGLSAAAGTRIGAGSSDARHGAAVDLPAGPSSLVGALRAGAARTLGAGCGIPVRAAGRHSQTYPHRGPSRARWLGRARRVRRH